VADPVVRTGHVQRGGMFQIPAHLRHQRRYERGQASRQARKNEIEEAKPVTVHAARRLEKKRPEPVGLQDSSTFRNVSKLADALR